MNENTIYDSQNTDTVKDEKRLPELWPGWKTVREIGVGGFGAVYEIQEETLGVKKSAALKVINIPKDSSEIGEMKSTGMDDASITSWFDECAQEILQEYELMQNLKGNTNIVYCDDVKAIRKPNGFGWTLYIKMELLTALPASMEKVALSESDIVQLGIDMCRALSLCQKHNIVHRDIKPQNIFVSADGNYKLGDFGIATISDHSTTGPVAGTYRYMAPEIYNGQKQGFRSDIYSLGMVLYWLLNDQRGPFLPPHPERVTKKDDEQARNRRFGGEPLPSPTHGSESLKKIVLKACAYKPEERYLSATEMLETLTRLDEPPVAEPPVAEPPVAEPPLVELPVIQTKPEMQPVKKKKSPWIIGIAAILTIAAVLFVVVLPKISYYRNWIHATLENSAAESQVEQEAVLAEADNVELEDGQSVQTVSKQWKYSSVTATVIDDTTLRFELTDERIPDSYTLSETPGIIEPWWNVILYFDFSNMVHYNIENVNNARNWQELDCSMSYDELSTGRSIYYSNAFDYQLIDNTLVFEVSIPKELDKTVYDIQGFRVNHGTEELNFSEGYDVVCSFQRTDAPGILEAPPEEGEAVLSVSEQWKYSSLTATAIDETTLLFELTDERIPNGYTISETPGKIKPWWNVEVKFDAFTIWYGLDGSMRSNLQNLDRHVTVNDHSTGGAYTYPSGFDYQLDGNTLVFEVSIPEDIGKTVYDIRSFSAYHQQENSDYGEGYQVPCSWITEKETIAAKAPSEEDVKVFGTEITYPQTESYLSDYETMYVKSYSGHSIYVFYKANVDEQFRRRFYLYEGDEVTVLARENGLSCVIFTASDGEEHIGWVNSANLVYEY